METNNNEENNEILFQILPFICVFKDGSFDRLPVPDVPPSADSLTSAISKDVDIAEGVSARLYLPANVRKDHNNLKLPLLVYIHGGGFTFGTARSPWYHKFMDTIVTECNVIGVSTNYRNAPEHLLPAAYEDSAKALEWIAACKDDWLIQYADYSRVFLGGDSAGANIAHNMLITKTTEKLGLNVDGMLMIHPYFWGEEKFESEIGDVEGRFLNPTYVDAHWAYLFPGTIGRDDPLINPMAPGAPSLRDFDCRRLLVFVAEKDLLRERGRAFVEALKKSGWTGEAEVVESAGEDHCFHFPKPQCDNAIAMYVKMKEFINKH